METKLINEEGHVFGTWNANTRVITIRRKGVDASFQLTEEGMFVLLEALTSKVA